MIPSIPIAIFFIPYAIFLVIYGVFLFFNLHHLKLYAAKHVSSQLLASLFLFGTLVILSVSAIVLSRYDWTVAINLEEVTTPLMNRAVINPF